MELSQLVFKSDTTELERASNLIGGLVTNMSKLDKASRDAAQTEATLAKAAKSNAEANLANAKAQDVRLKSTIAADKADQSNEKSQVAKTKALESHTKATQENVSILQRQTDIYDFLAQGFSKGQAGILASAKATGQYSKELEQVLELQKQFTSDPFDRSDTGLKRLQRTIKEVTDAQGFFNAGHNLTSKQARELSNDLDRLNAGMKQQGKSYQDITKAQAVYKQQFIDEAAAVNKANSALAMVEKQRKDVVSATNYVTAADQKMVAALNQSNATLDKGSTDSLAKYESALRKSGMAQDVLTQKLATYKTQLAQVQSQEMKRREQNLTRAASPQITDLAVSLYSGQAPLTVLLQQGGQLVDILKLSGVEAEKFGSILKTSFYSMVPAIKQVTVGIAGLVTGLFIDAGSAITSFVGRVTGISAAMEVVKRAVVSGGEENFKYVASLQRIGSVAAGATAAGLAAFLAVLVAVALEYKKIVQSEGELSKALATSGGAMAVSKDQAVAYAEGMQSVGVGTLKAVDAITEFTKVGKIGKDGLDLIIKSALDLEKYAGVAISDTAKKFSELQDEPTKALIKFAESNGYVSASVLDTVAALEQQGDKTAAATAATEAMRIANNAMADEARANLSPIESLWDNIRSAIGKVKQEIYDLTTSNEVIGAMKTVWETVAVVVAEVWFTIKGVGKEIGGVAAQIAAVMRGDFSGAGAIGDQMKIDAKSAREEQDKLVQSILNRGTAEKKNFSDSKEQNSQYAAWRKDNEKAIERQYSKEERLGLKKKQLQNDLNAGIIDEVKYKQALAGWERIIMGEKKPKDTSKQAARELDQYSDILNKVNGLSSSYNNELTTLQKLRSQNKITEEQYVQAVEELIRLQPFYIAQQKEINAAHDLSNKLLGKQDMLGKDYYKTLEDIDKYQKMGVENGGYSVEHANKLRQAAFEQTQLFKEQVKYTEESTKNLIKYKEEAQKSLDTTSLENQKLDDRVALLNLTTEQQKYLKIQQQQRNSLLQVEQKLTQQIAKIWEDVRQGKLDPFDAMAAQIAAEKAAADERKLINKEVAVQYAEDFMAEMQKIKSGISDSIVTALFEGGKAGSKKIRDTLVSVLRQKVTMVVDVGVNAVLNNLIGGALGGATSSGGASIIGSAAASAGGSLFAGATGLGTTSSLLGGFSGSIIPASMVGPSVAAPTVMSGVGNALSAIPGWGWALAAVGALAAIFGKKATPHAGAASSYSAAGGLVSGADIYATSGLADTRTYKSEVEKITGGIAQTVGQTLDATAKAFGKTAGFEISTAFADDTSKDGAWGSLVIKSMGKEVLNWADTQVSKWAPKEFADGEEGVKQYIAAVAVSMRDALVNMDLPGWANDMLEAVGDTPSVENIQQVITQINAAGVALENMRKNLVGFSEYTDASVSKLVSASGGIENLINAASVYYENFYSEAERTANATRDIAESLNKMGFEMPTTREGFRALVEQQQALGESGTESVAALLKLSGAFASITEAVGETVTEVQALAKAERERMQAARESANKLVEEQTKSFKNLQDSLNKEAFKSKGGMSYGFNVSISEVQSSEKFIDALDSATASLAELEKLNLGSEFEKYASELGKVIQGTRELFANTLAVSRLAQGDAQGAIAAKMGASQLNPANFSTAGAFNSAYAKEQAIAAKSLVDVANANALTTSNVSSVIGQLNAFASSELILNEIKQGFIQGVREASNTTSTYVVRDAIQGLAGVFAGAEANRQFLNTSTGLPAIAAAYASAADMQKVQMVDGARYMGEFSISYATAISNLTAGFNSGKITTEELKGAVKSLEHSFGSLKDYAVTPVDIEMARIGASSNIATEGIKALNLYFGQLTDRAAELAEQAKIAAEPIAVVTDVIGRMASFTDVFGKSANAVLNGFRGMGSEGIAGLQGAVTYGSQTRKALLISEAASIAGTTITTADASKVAEKIQENPAFAKLTAAGIRDVAMLLDGLKQFDANSFEKVFVRISEALNQGALNEEQYAALFDESINIFTDHDAKIKQVTDSFDSLRKAAESLADQLLIDAGYTSLSGSQTLEEAQRQYNEIMLRALGGDVTAASELNGITQQMLDIAKQQSQDESAYNRIFGATISDLRTVESLQTPKVLSEPIKVNAESNAELIEQIKLLREEIRASNAQIASNTDKTNKSLQEFQVNGMPTVALE